MRKYFNVNLFIMAVWFLLCLPILSCTTASLLMENPGLTAKAVGQAYIETEAPFWIERKQLSRLCNLIYEQKLGLPVKLKISYKKARAEIRSELGSKSSEIIIGEMGPNEKGRAFIACSITNDETIFTILLNTNPCILRIWAGKVMRTLGILQQEDPGFEEDWASYLLKTLPGTVIKREAELSSFSIKKTIIGEKATVIVKVANIREEPSINSTIIKRAHKGDTFNVKEKRKNWIKILWKEKKTVDFGTLKKQVEVTEEGWIFKKLVRIQ